MQHRHILRTFLTIPLIGKQPNQVTPPSDYHQLPGWSSKQCALSALKSILGLIGILARSMAHLLRLPNTLIYVPKCLPFLDANYQVNRLSKVLPWLWKTLDQLRTSLEC